MGNGNSKKSDISIEIKTSNNFEELVIDVQTANKM
jgi:hypothetical protein